MTPFEIIALLISSGVFSALLALFYRFGQNQERQDVYFKSTDKAIGDLNSKIDKVGFDLNTKIDQNETKFNVKIDKLDNKIDKLGFDLNTKIDKAVVDLTGKIDKTESILNTKIDKTSIDLNAKLDSKIDPIEKDLIQMNTRMAVIESRLSDISTNVTHLMWHNQAIPPKEELKEN